MGINAIAAADNLNTTLNENDLKESSDFLQQSDEYSLVNSNAGDVISDSSSNSKTVTIVADKTNPNQVLKPLNSIIVLWVTFIKNILVMIINMKLNLHSSQLCNVSFPEP